MMEVWNSHGKWEVPKPYLIGGSADPMLVCISDAQILTLTWKKIAKKSQKEPKLDFPRHYVAEPGKA